MALGTDTSYGNTGFSSSASINTSTAVHKAQAEAAATSSTDTDTDSTDDTVNADQKENPSRPNLLNGLLDLTPTQLKTRLKEISNAGDILFISASDISEMSPEQLMILAPYMGEMTTEQLLAINEEQLLALLSVEHNAENIKIDPDSGYDQIPPDATWEVRGDEVVIFDQDGNEIGSGTYTGEGVSTVEAYKEALVDLEEAVSQVSEEIREILGIGDDEIPTDVEEEVLKRTAEGESAEDIANALQNDSGLFSQIQDSLGQGLTTLQLVFLVFLIIAEADQKVLEGRIKILEGKNKDLDRYNDAKTQLEALKSQFKSDDTVHGNERVEIPESVENLLIEVQNSRPGDATIYDRPEDGGLGIEPPQDGEPTTITKAQIDVAIQALQSVQESITTENQRDSIRLQQIQGEASAAWTGSTNALRAWTSLLSEIARNVGP